MKECASRKAATARRRWGFLARLFRDHRGNTLAIVGAAMIPLAAMIGSGVDMSRAYMAKTRLQSACDAAALAGRRVMANDALGTNVEPEARRFFHFNFPKTTANGVTTGPYQTAEIVDPIVTRPAAGTVRVSASTTIPTSVMRMFGFTTLPLSVTCDASLNFVNTDVMLVLDTTGSMNNDINDNTTTNDSLRKITALRAAVMALYVQLRPTQVQLEANQLRLRYGIVPYSSSVNVGALVRAVDPNYISNSVTYQSRVANYTTMVSSPPTTNGPYWEYYRGPTNLIGTVASQATTGITQAHCLNFMNNQSFSQSTNPTYTFTATVPPTGGPAPAPTIVTTFPSDGTATSGGTAGEWGWTGAPVTATRKSCRRLRTDVTTTYRFSYTNDTFQPVTYDTSAFKLANTFVTVANPANGGATTDFTGTVPTSGPYSLQSLAAAATGGTGLTTRSVAWNGCIEERATDYSIDGNSGMTIPTGAYDLNINFIPNSDATRWRPMWPQVVNLRTAGSASANSGTRIEDMSADAAFYACPSEARRLQAWTQAEMQAYVDALAPVGGTYHDIGMIWGARLLSNAGIFAADNPDTFHSMPVTRHIIFMTDGNLAPNCNTYTAWGVEQNDRRVTNSASCADQRGRHMQRFQMVCNAARGMGFSVWVIAFGTVLTDEMKACASNPNQAAASSSSADLIDRFRQIGANIGALRLTQ
jgi:Flp pilus assembly protein TadG